LPVFASHARKQPSSVASASRRVSCPSSRDARAEGPDVGLAIGYQAGNFDAPPQSLVQYRTHKGAIKSFEELAKIPGLRAGIFDYRKENIVY